MSDDDAGGASASDEEGERGGVGGEKRVLSAKRLEKLQLRAEKKGVVYLSLIPPFMKPVKLRHLLEQHGDVLRIYLAAEGARSAQRSAQAAAQGFRGRTGKRTA